MTKAAAVAASQRNFNLSACSADELAWLPHWERQLGHEPEEFAGAKLDRPNPTFASYDIALGAAIVTELLRGKSADPLAHSWCEKLMRFCELRRFELLTRAEAKWGDREQASNGLLSIAGLLAEAAICLGDFRFLSTALKVIETVEKWNRPRHPATAEDGGPISCHAALACDAALKSLAHQHA